MTPEQRNQLARRYVASFAQNGARTFIGNLDTSVDLLKWGDYELPITINHGDAGQTFVCSPQIGSIDYAIEELSHFPNRSLVPILRGLIGGLGKALSLSDVNKIVHINNWMMSTNLPVPIDPSLAKRQTDRLVVTYPAHFLAMRSLTRRYNANLITSLISAGWVLLPSRQVFLIDDVVRKSMPHRDTQRDDKLWRRGEYVYEEPERLSTEDAERIVELYNLLYLDKYSRLNPAYTARFIALTHEIGMIRYLVLRDRSGVIQAFGGMHHLGQHGTMPLIGYNTAIDRQHGLYRLAFHAGTLYAARHGLLFNMSSGASAFKRNRGAYAEMEFTAFYIRHLPLSRRIPFDLLRTAATHIGAPLLKRYHL